MKNHLPFDQHFKSQLEDVESWVPDHLFENIMAERKRRRGFALFSQNNSLKYGLAACALLAATGLIFLKWNQKKVQQPVAVSATVQQLVPVAPASVTVEQPTATLSASVTLPNAVLETASPHLTSPQNSTLYKSKTLAFNNLDKITLAQTTQTDVKANHLVPSVGQLESQANRMVSNIELPKNERGVVNGVENQQDIVVVSDIENEQDAVSSVENQQEVVNGVENQQEVVVNDVENQTVKRANQATKRPKKSRTISLLPTQKVDLRQGQVKSSDVRYAARIVGPEINCPNFNLRKPSRWYIDIWGSPDYVLRKLYNNQGENTFYANARDSVEHSWYGFSAGARVSLVLESGVAVRAGLNYLQNNEIFDYKKPGEVRTITITETVKQQDGTILTTTRTEKQYGTYQLKKYNRYRSLHLPIQLGYEFGRMPWSYSVNGGINFNLTSWRKAEILNPALVPFDASKKDANVFKSNIGASLYASFAAYYDWKDYTQLFVEPYIRHFLSPITTKDYLLEQRYTDVGLKLGIRWRL